MPNEMPHQMMRYNHAKALHDKISKKAPIEGVWIGDPDDKSTWGIHFKNTVTDPQIVEANAELQAYDPFPTVVETELRRASEKVGNFIQDKYSIMHQSALSSMRLESKIKNKAAAESYLDPLWNWIDNVMDIYYQKEDEILALTQHPTKTVKEKEDEIVAIVDNIDLTSFEASDPKVTLKQARTLLKAE